MNDKLFLIMYLFAMLGVFVTLLAACSAFWSVFYAVKDFIRRKRKSAQRAAQKRTDKAA